MKKIIGFTIALSMISLLVSCSTGNNETDNSSSDQKPSSAINNNTDDNDQDDEISEEDDDEFGFDMEFDAGDFVMPEFDKSSTIESTVILDSQGIKVTAQELNYTSSRAELEILIENNSDKKYHYYAGTSGYACSSINNYMVSDGYACGDIESGQSVNKTVEFSLEQLLLLGMDNIAQINLGIDFEDEDNNRIYCGDIPIKTSGYDKYDFNKDYYKELINSNTLEKIYKCKIERYDNEDLFDCKGLKGTSSLFLVNETGDRVWFTDVYNDSDEVLYLSLRELSADGLMLDDYIGGAYVYPHNHYIASAKLYSDDVGEILGITKPKKIEFTVLTSQRKASVIGSGTVKIPYGDTQVDYMSTGKELINEDTVRIIHKGFLKTSYVTEMYMICENKSDEKITITDNENTLLVNNSSSEYKFFNTIVEPNSMSILIYKLDNDSLKELNIASDSDIEKIDFSIIIKDYKTFSDIKTLDISYKKD